MGFTISLLRYKLSYFIVIFILIIVVIVIIVIIFVFSRSSQFFFSGLQMVLHDSPPHPDTSNILHQFLISDSITTQNQFDQNQHFDAYGSSSFRNDNDSNNMALYPTSLGVLPSIQSLGERMSRSIDLVQGGPPTVSSESEISHTRRLMDLLGAANDTNHNQHHQNQQTQRLSLSLNSHILVPHVQYRQRSLNSDLISQNYLLSGDHQEPRDQACTATSTTSTNPGVEHVVNDDYPFPGSSLASSSASLNRHCSTLYGAESLSNVVGQSRYLRPTQTLLEEIVSLGGRAVDLSNEKYISKLFRGSRRGSLTLSSELKAEFCNNGVMSVEKQECHIKIARLISLLEEVGLVINSSNNLSVHFFSLLVFEVLFWFWICKR